MRNEIDFREKNTWKPVGSATKNTWKNGSTRNDSSVCFVHKYAGCCQRRKTTKGDFSPYPIEFFLQ